MIGTDEELQADLARADQLTRGAIEECNRNTVRSVLLTFGGPHTVATFDRLVQDAQVKQDPHLLEAAQLLRRESTWSQWLQHRRVWLAKDKSDHMASDAINAEAATCTHSGYHHAAEEKPTGVPSATEVKWVRDILLSVGEPRSWLAVELFNRVVQAALTSASLRAPHSSPREELCSLGTGHDGPCNQKAWRWDCPPGRARKAEEAAAYGVLLPQWSTHG